MNDIVLIILFCFLGAVNVLGLLFWLWMWKAKSWRHPSSMYLDPEIMAVIDKHMTSLPDCRINKYGTQVMIDPGRNTGPVCSCKEAGPFQHWRTDPNCDCQKED